MKDHDQRQHEIGSLIHGIEDGFVTQLEQASHEFYSRHFSSAGIVQGVKLVLISSDQQRMQIHVNMGGVPNIDETRVVQNLEDNKFAFSMISYC